MLAFARKLHDELLLKLKNQDEQHDQEAFIPDHRLACIQESMERLKAELESHSFATEDEEVEFYKELLPLFLSLSIYYKEKFELDSIGLLGTPQIRSEYFDHLFLRIGDFLKENVEFLRYYRSGKTNLDKYYFLGSSSFQQAKRDLLLSATDPFFYTVYSNKVAGILAYTRLERDIRGLFLKKEHPVAAPDPGENKLRWTDSKTGLTELVYSLRAQGAFNYGNASLKEISACVENAFSIDLGNTSSCFQDILRRKSGYTNYLDMLREKLNGKIDEIEKGNMQ